MRARFAPGKERGRGQALVEFALVFPLLLLLVFGLIDLGRLVYANNALSEAAREGARYGSVQARSATSIAAIEAYTVSHVVGIGGVTATATCIRPGVVVMPCAPNDTLEVRARVTVDMITPVIAQLMTAAGLNPFNLQSTANVLVNN
jgi:Flp pilus assembly protein TadG